MYPPNDPQQQKKKTNALGYQGNPTGNPGAHTNGAVDMAPGVFNSSTPQATTNGGVRLGDPSAAPPVAATNTATGVDHPPMGPGMPTAPPAAPAAPAPVTSPILGRAEAAQFEQNDPHFFDRLNNNDPVPGQPGARFVHNGQGWTIVSQGAAGAPAAPAAPGTPTAPTGAPVAPAAPQVPMTAGDVTGTTAPVPGQPAAPPTSIAQSFQQALISRLNPQAVTQDDPAIKGSIQANKLAEQRGVEANQNHLAEQAARDGTAGAGGMGSLQRGLVADSAARQGQYAGDAVQHQSDLNHQDMLAALGLGGGFLQQNANRDQQGGQFSQTLSEQKRQSDVDAELRRLGITTQGNLGQGDLSLRQRLGEGGLNNQLLGLLLNNQQFGQQLGQQNSQFGQSLGQSGILGLLGLL